MAKKKLETEQERLERLTSIPYTWVADVEYRLVVTFCTLNGRRDGVYKTRRSIYLLENQVVDGLESLFQMAVVDARTVGYEAIASVSRSNACPPIAERIAELVDVGRPEFRVVSIYALEVGMEDEVAPDYVYREKGRQNWMPVSDAAWQSD